MTLKIKEYITIEQFDTAFNPMIDSNKIVIKKILQNVAGSIKIKHLL